MIILDINENNFEEERAKGNDSLLEKFEMVDSLLDKLDEEEAKRKLGVLYMKDPTCWAYGNLRDKEGKRIRLYPFPRGSCPGFKNTIIRCFW